jgi:hypothetical protein
MSIVSQKLKFEDWKGKVFLYTEEEADRLHDKYIANRKQWPYWKKVVAHNPDPKDDDDWDSQEVMIRTSKKEQETIYAALQARKNPALHMLLKVVG